jgi:carbon storage regulator
VITVVEIRVDKVRLGIEAPKDVPVHRKEIFEIIKSAETTSPATSEN